MAQNFVLHCYILELESTFSHLTVKIARFINAGIGTWRQCFGDIGHT